MEEKVYTLFPIDWDYDCEELPKWLKVHKKTKNDAPPYNIKNVNIACGVFSSEEPLENIVNSVKELKQKWPIIKFGLYEGRWWDEMELIKEF